MPSRTRTALADHLRLGLPPALFSVAACNFTLFVAQKITLPVLPLLARALGAGPLLIGVTVGSSAVLPILLALPAGWLTSRLGTRTLQVAAAVSLVCGMALMRLAHTIPLLILAQVLVGLCVMLASVGGQAFIAAVTERHQRDDSYGRYSLLVGLPDMVGPALGGLLADWGGPHLAVSAALGLAVLTLPLSIAVAGVAGTLPPPPGRLIVSSMVILRMRAVPYILTAAFLAVFAHSLKASFYVLYLETTGFSGLAIGMLLAVSGATSMAIRPLLAFATGSFGRGRVLALICLAMGFGFGLVPLAASAAGGQAALAVLTGLAYGLSQPLTLALVSLAVPRESLGLAFGWRQVFQRAAELSSPLLLGALVSGAGLESAFWATGLVLLLAGVGVQRARFA